MNIDRVNQNLASGAYGRRAGKAGEAGRSEEGGASTRSSGSKGAAPADGVELSGRARSIQRAEAAVRAAPDVRENVVAELKQRIDNGQYTIDDPAIARRLLEEDGP